jgi:APA family basic amino acid/polyamine antiporter
MSQTSEGLKRDIRRWDLVALFINVTVGAGVFRLPSEVFRAAGVYSLFAFLTCAVVIGLIILCFAEVASRFTETGGPYLYGREAFGPAFGFMIGWLMWITRLAGFATLSEVLVVSLGYFWPAAMIGLPRAMIITGMVILLTVVNIIGVRESAIVGNIFTVTKLVPLLLFIGVGLFFINRENFSFRARPNVASFSSAVFILVFVFSGFEAVLINSGEVREPQRNIPFALVTSLGAVAMLFILVQVVCVGTLPQLASSERPLADAGSIFLGAAGASIISAGALVSVVGTMNTVFLACSRLPFGMAEQGQLPRLLLRTHRRFRTPYVAITVTAAAVLGLTLSRTFIYVLTLSTITRVIVYAGTCAALPVLRRRSGRAASFKAPAGLAVSVVCIALCGWLLFSSGWQAARDVAIAAAFGFMLYRAPGLVKSARKLRARNKY